ncbi:unnamed protein product, partial [Mesorhabditis spiculigera]
MDQPGSQDDTDTPSQNGDSGENPSPNGGDSHENPSPHDPPPNPHPNPHPNPNPMPHPNPHPHPNQHPKPDPKPNPHPNPHPNPRPNPHPHPNDPSNPEPQTGSHPGAQNGDVSQPEPLVGYSNSRRHPGVVHGKENLGIPLPNPFPKDEREWRKEDLVEYECQSLSAGVATDDPDCGPANFESDYGVYTRCGYMVPYSSYLYEQIEDGKYNGPADMQGRPKTCVRAIKCREDADCRFYEWGWNFDWANCDHMMIWGADKVYRTVKVCNLQLQLNKTLPPPGFIPAPIPKRPVNPKPHH